METQYLARCMNYNWAPEAMNEMPAIRFQRLLEVERQMQEIKQEAEAMQRAEADHQARVAAAMSRR